MRRKEEEEGEAFPRKKEAQSRSQSYCAFWTKGTMCLAAESFCNNTEVAKGGKKSRFLHLLQYDVCFFLRVFSCQKYP